MYLTKNQHLKYNFLIKYKSKYVLLITFKVVDLAKKLYQSDNVIK